MHESRTLKQIKDQIKSEFFSSSSSPFLTVGFAVSSEVSGSESSTLLGAAQEEQQASSV
jgi:hypothetical protein